MGWCGVLSIRFSAASAARVSRRVGVIGGALDMPEDIIPATRKPNHLCAVGSRSLNGALEERFSALYTVFMEDRERLRFSLNTVVKAVRSKLESASLSKRRAGTSPSTATKRTRGM